RRTRAVATGRTSLSPGAGYPWTCARSWTPCPGTKGRPGPSRRSSSSAARSAGIRVTRRSGRGSSRLADLLQNGGRGAERLAFVGGELLQALGQPGLTAAADPLHQVPALVGHGQDDLPAVGGVRLAPDQAALLEHRDHPGHRRRLDLLVVGELAGSHRFVALERGERRELDVGEDGLGAAKSEALHA